MAELACVAEEELSVTHLRQIMLEELKRQDAFAGGRGFTLVQRDKVSTPAEPTGAGH
jgi:hypothetical protein